MKSRTISWVGYAPVNWMISDKQEIYLSQLFGLQGVCEEADWFPGSCRMMFDLKLNGKQVRGGDLKLTHREISDKTAILRWNVGNVEVESRWMVCNEGLVQRNDFICNKGIEPVRISRCYSRFVFQPLQYEYFVQSSAWCNESQGYWGNLHAYGMCLSNEGGRTTQGWAPFLSLRDKDKQGAVFHLLPRGNWKIKVFTKNNVMGGFISSIPNRILIVDMGLSDDDLDIEVETQGIFELPTILVSALPEGKVESAAPLLHEYLNSTVTHYNKHIPVVYNTWFDQFDKIDFQRLNVQLEAAKEIGCEIFCIDAGWYGIPDGQWGSQVGNWHDKTGGQLKEFSDRVREKGLGFGLWMEPERYFSELKIVRDNPTWFGEGYVPGKEKFVYPNLVLPDVQAFVYSEICRLIESYQLSWMKLDFNFELLQDPQHAEFYFYYKSFYKMMDQLKRCYPEVVFEGCASGGLRLENESIRHFTGHFLSDNVNPCDMLRIYEQSIMRVSPGLITRWAVLREVGKTIPDYGKTVEETSPKIVAPTGTGATWSRSETVDPVFSACIAMAGILGFSGDIASLSNEHKKSLKQCVQYYKLFRNIIYGSKAYLLTGLTCKNDHSGWSAIELHNKDFDKILLFVYRLDDWRSQMQFKLKGLTPQKKYVLTQIIGVTDFSNDKIFIESDGQVVIELKSPFQAGIYEIKSST